MNTKLITELLKKTKSRNKRIKEEAMEELIVTYLPLIHKLAYQICPTCNIEDMVQSGKMGVLIAISTYNNKSSFGTWVFTQIRNQLQKQREIEFPVKISRFLLKKGCKASFEYVNDETINNQIDNTAVYNQQPYDNLILIEDRARVTDVLRHINKMFSKKYCLIFTRYYFEGFTLAYLSDKYQINCKHIIAKMIEEIRKNAITDYNNTDAT